MSEKFKMYVENIESGADSLTSQQLHALAREESKFKVPEKEKKRVKQEFRDEVNINTIMKRARNGMPLVDPTQVNYKRVATFDDVSNVDGFQQVQDKLIEGKRMFTQLPSEIRAEFDNNPAKFLDFMSNPDNEEVAREMGLLAPLPTKPEVVDPVPPEPVDPPPEPEA